MRPVYGNDCEFRIKVDGVFYPLLCATEFTIEVTQDILESTSVGSGTWREFVARGISAYTLSLNGVTKIDNTDGQISWFYMVLEQVRGTVREVQLLWEDADGNTQVFTGNVLIPTMSLTTPIGDFASGTIDFQGTGGITIDSVVSDPASALCEVQDTLEYTLAEDAVSITVSEITVANARVLWVSREGTLHRLTTGTPGNREYTVDYGTGNITFLAPGNPGGEGVEVGWQITA